MQRFQGERVLCLRNLRLVWLQQREKMACNEVREGNKGPNNV